MQIQGEYSFVQPAPVTVFFKRYINAMAIFFPIASFLVIPSVQGTTIVTVMAGLLFAMLIALPAGINKWLLLKELAVFLAIFLVFSVTSQFINLVYEIRLDESLVLVNRGSFLDYFYRTSHITQSLYLLFAILIYLFIKYYSDESLIKYIYWGIRLLCFYGIYEVLFFLIMGHTGDFIVNRKFGDVDASFSQKVVVAGLHILRMKSYTGEPSMFTFTVFPFWALTYVLNRKFDKFLTFGCLALTFSTTAYFAMGMFHTLWFLYKGKYKQVIYVFAFIFILLAMSQLDAFRDKIAGIYEFVFGNKISGNSSSSQSRGGNIATHIAYWTKLNGWSKIFGIGFGYIRSTDFFTTLLVNNGLLGLLVFSGFFFKSFKLGLTNKDLKFCYFTGMILLFFILMATVPEFAYPSMWIYLALGYVWKNAEKMQTYEK
ncbi:hypothetical protein [Olivibacter domesticus]|uniref:O-antigen ligase like membrane protein n=1 Tax=Olivibacter domesticus TaxID=407022 RepID=A0A1H7YXV2_OLID1|nr:hypothetical protein [Olivibacter domesticus]SEM50624.1 hypothetical protein SAMN05661044_05368 [Olivibacter domesticus]